jgi:hypothetical protein
MPDLVWEATQTEEYLPLDPECAKAVRALLEGPPDLHAWRRDMPGNPWIGPGLGEAVGHLLWNTLAINDPLMAIRAVLGLIEDALSGHAEQVCWGLELASSLRGFLCAPGPNDPSFLPAPWARGFPPEEQVFLTDRLAAALRKRPHEEVLVELPAETIAAAADLLVLLSFADPSNAPAPYEARRTRIFEAIRPWFIDLEAARRGLRAELWSRFRIAAWEIGIGDQRRHRS